VDFAIVVAAGASLISWRLAPWIVVGSTGLLGALVAAV